MAKISKTSSYQTFCLNTGFWNLFVLESSTSNVLKSRVDNYCAVHRDLDPILNEIVNAIRFDQVRFFSLTNSSRTFFFLAFSDHEFLLGFQIFQRRFSRLGEDFLHVEPNFAVVRPRSSISFEHNFSDQRIFLSNQRRRTESLRVRRFFLFSDDENIFLSRFSSSYTFSKQIIKTFNPKLLELPAFRSLDIAIPILTPLVNFDQIFSLITGLPRGTIDNIIRNVNEVNNFLTTPSSQRVRQISFFLIWVRPLKPVAARSA